jgi:hypothetical protein
MKRSFFSTVLGTAVFGLPLLAQTATVTQQTMTTGMVGLSYNQTARLNVLNLNPVVSTTPAPANCNVELEFVDASNVVQKSAVALNFAPQKATSLDFPGKAIISSTAMQRTEIRGVVVINPPIPIAISLAPGPCTVKVTLEIFDNISGATTVVTSDTSTVPSPVATPAATVK